MATVVKGQIKRSYNATLRQDLARITRQRIVEAARRLLVNGTYSSVRMDDIAKEAGVAYQTVYAVFGTKLQLAHAMIDIGFHVEGVDELIAHAHETPDPEVALRTGARIARRLNEHCADLVRFMRESSDPDLLERQREMEARHLDNVSAVPEMLQRSGRLRPNISLIEARDVIWGMTGPSWYIQLVFQRSWAPSRYEEWLGDSLVNLLLQP